MPPRSLKLFNPEKHTVHHLGDSLAIVCPGFQTDPDAPVNVDSERRAIIKCMGSSIGVTVIDEARTNFKARQQEVSLDIDLSNADTTIAKIEQRVASDGFSVDGFSADFCVNCTHASSVLTNVNTGAARSQAWLR